MFGFKIVSDASGKHILPKKKSKRLLWVLLPKYIALLLLLLFVVLSSLHCTSAPNGAFNHTPPLVSINGEIVDKWPDHPKKMEFPIKDTRDKIHYYNQPVIMHHMEILVLYCREDKQWEKVRAYWNHKESIYDYSVTRMRKQ
jgi:hypothetical protein